jgi:hypothetical protein
MCVANSMKWFVFEECVWQTVFCFFRGKHDITHSQQCLRVHLHILVAKETIHTPPEAKEHTTFAKLWAPPFAVFDKTDLAQFYQMIGF